jgi:peptide/nickel transport system ATP-binding protein
VGIARVEGAPEVEIDVGGSKLLEVRGLKASFVSRDHIATAVDGVSFDLDRGQTLAVVGESGSGKSVMARAILGLHPTSGYTVSGEVRLNGEQLLGQPPRRLRRLRGEAMAMIFQDPLSALHPYYRVGWQLVESLHATDTRMSKRAAQKRAIDMLEHVGISDPQKRFRDYPHQLSGGMRQRAMIAMALLRRPQLLIADEPTTALDVTVQTQILALIKELQEEYRTGVILITHDLGVAAEVADDIVVMYGGQVMEHGSVDSVLTRPQHPYTWGLLKSLTRLDRERQARLEPISGAPARAGDVPSGCPFHPRCPYATSLGKLCSTDQPLLARTTAGEQLVACHLPSAARDEIIRSDIQQWLTTPSTESDLAAKG